MDCFHEGPNFLAIDPEECIDCTLCVEEYPVSAVFDENDVPAGQEHSSYRTLITSASTIRKKGTLPIMRLWDVFYNIGCENDE